MQWESKSKPTRIWTDVPLQLWDNFIWRTKFCLHNLMLSHCCQMNNAICTLYLVCNWQDCPLGFCSWKLGGVSQHQWSYSHAKTVYWGGNLQPIILNRLYQHWWVQEQGLRAGRAVLRKEQPCSEAVLLLGWAADIVLHHHQKLKV